jgi:lia operon protein LiaG
MLVPSATRDLRFTNAGLFLLSTILAGPSLAQQAEQRSVKGTEIAIYNIAGKVRAVPGTGDAVAVEITRGGADASKLKIETGAVRGRETLRVIYPSDRIIYPDFRGRTSLSVRSDGTFSDGGSDWRDWDRDRDRVDIRPSGSGLEAWADLVVRVPKGQKIELYLAIGRVEVSNVEGDVVVDVSAADVDVSGTKGPLTLDTGSGRITVRDVTGDLNVDAGSGGISIDRVKGTSLRLDSGSGSVQASDIDVRDLEVDVGSGGLRMYRVKAPIVSAETGSGGITLEMLSEIERMNIETGSGGATIRVPATTSAEVEAETGSGGFQTDFEITTRRMSRNHVTGRIGDGKGRISIEAGSGTVRLLKN